MGTRWDPRDEPEPITLGGFLIALAVFLFVIFGFVAGLLVAAAAMDVLP